MFCSTKRTESPSALRPRMSVNISSTSSGDSPSEGSSRMSRRGSAISPRPIASHLLLSSRERPGRLARALGKTGEGGEDAFQIGAAPRSAATVAAELEVLAHAHIGEDLAALRDMDQPGCYDGRARSAVDPPAGEADLARALRQEPGEGAVERCLAGAVRA